MLKRTTLLFAVLLLAGCGASVKPYPDPAHNAAQYVRDHHCVKESHEPPRTEFDYGKGKFSTYHGWWNYNCGFDEEILIYDDEEQP